MLNPETAFHDAKRKPGGGWKAKCPAHDDSTASLSIDPGRNGGLVLKCFAGCDTNRILSEAGLSMADLFPEKSAATKATITATYKYCDEGGQHLYDVCRFDPKDFRQRRADGVWKMHGVRRAVYHLDKLQGQTTVYIPEGEKDVDRLWSIGLTATCNAGGASKWKEDYTGQLKAAAVERVVILPDNDEPGRLHADEIARSCHAAGFLVKVVALPGVPSKGDVSDWLDAGHTKDDLVKLVKATPLYTPSAASTVPSETISDDGDMDMDDDPEPATKKKSQATELIDLADDCGVELWHTPTNDPYGTITVNDHREHYALGRIVKDYLALQYYRRHGKSANSQALNDAALTLRGKALYDGEKHEIAVRLAAHGDKMYLDLGDPDWRAVEIDANGWRIVMNPPVRHWRPPSLRPLPEPVAGGSLDALRQLWPAINDETWCLSASWLVATLMPRGPYPILVETGEQGSGKSTYGRMLRGLIDPATPDLRNVPRNEHDVMIGATKSYVVVLDNLSGLPVWLSDALCRIATGGGLATRTLYSDLDETLIDVTRPILLNGIDSPATRGDLLDRALIVTLPAMCDNDRGEELDLWARYHAMRPALLGALLDAASCALRRRATVKLKAKPRMADACTWVTAAEPALGWPDGLTVQTWMGARATASADLLASDQVAVAVMDMALPWEGTSTELLKRLPVPERSAKSWPETGRKLSGALRRLASDLRRAGVDIEFPDDHNREAGTGRRVLKIRKVGDQPSQPSRSSRGGQLGLISAENHDGACDGMGDDRPDRHSDRHSGSAGLGPDFVDRDDRDGCDGLLHTQSIEPDERQAEVTASPNGKVVRLYDHAV